MRKSPEQLDLLAWVAPRKVIPFPAKSRIGQARKVALMLAKASTQKQADRVIEKASSELFQQMRASMVSEEDIIKEYQSFLVAVRSECFKIDAGWLPTIPTRFDQESGGAA